MWCVEGVWEGFLEVTPYELLENRDGRYRFESRGTMNAGPGSAGSLIPRTGMYDPQSQRRRDRRLAAHLSRYDERLLGVPAGQRLVRARRTQAVARSHALVRQDDSVAPPIAATACSANRIHHSPAPAAAACAPLRRVRARENFSFSAGEHFVVHRRVGSLRYGFPRRCRTDSHGRRDESNKEIPMNRSNASLVSLSWPPARRHRLVRDRADHARRRERTDEVGPARDRYLDHHQGEDRAGHHRRREEHGNRRQDGRRRRHAAGVLATDVAVKKAVAAAESVKGVKRVDASGLKSKD